VPPRARGAGDLGPAKAESPALGVRVSLARTTRTHVLSPRALRLCARGHRARQRAVASASLHSTILEEHRNTFLEGSPGSHSRTAGDGPKIPPHDTTDASGLHRAYWASSVRVPRAVARKRGPRVPRTREVATWQACLTSPFITRIYTASDVPGGAVSSLCNNRAQQEDSGRAAQGLGRTRRCRRAVKGFPSTPWRWGHTGGAARAAL
jgi:hypothetical protein